MRQSALDVLGIIGGLITAGGAIASFVFWYHNMDLKRDRENIKDAAVEAVINRMQRLDDLDCVATLSPDLYAIRERLRGRYFELTGREYTAPDCTEE